MIKELKKIPYNAILSLILFIILVFVMEYKLKLAITLSVYYSYLLFDEYIKKVIKDKLIGRVKKV